MLAIRGPRSFSVPAPHLILGILPSFGGCEVRTIWPWLEDWFFFIASVLIIVMAINLSERNYSVMECRLSQDAKKAAREAFLGAPHVVKYRENLVGSWPVLLRRFFIEEAVEAQLFAQPHRGFEMIPAIIT